jgi:hypothetical protein
MKDLASRRGSRALPLHPQQAGLAPLELHHPPDVRAGSERRQEGIRHLAGIERAESRIDQQL